MNIWRVILVKPIFILKLYENLPFFFIHKTTKEDFTDMIDKLKQEFSGETIFCKFVEISNNSRKTN